MTLELNNEWAGEGYRFHENCFRTLNVVHVPIEHEGLLLYARGVETLVLTVYVIQWYNLQIDVSIFCGGTESIKLGNYFTSSECGRSYQNLVIK